MPKKVRKPKLTKAERQVKQLLCGYHYFLGGSKSVLQKISSATGIRCGRAIVSLIEVQDQIRNYMRRSN